MPRMNDQPRPIPTDGVGLPMELVTLGERVAENAHGPWAAQRLSEGWSYGPQRDDGRKPHPCPISYAGLPDSEQEYGRLAALGPLKAILKPGCRIVPPQS